MNHITNKGIFLTACIKEDGEGDGNEERNLIASVGNSYLIKTTSTITRPEKRKIFSASKKSKKEEERKQQFSLWMDHLL